MNNKKLTIMSSDNEKMSKQTLLSGSFQSNLLHNHASVLVGVFDKCCHDVQHFMSELPVHENEENSLQRVYFRGN